MYYVGDFTASLVMMSKVTYHNRSYPTLGVNFRGWCLMKAVATLRKLETLNNKSSHSETHNDELILGIMRFWSFTPSDSEIWPLTVRLTAVQ